MTCDEDKKDNTQGKDIKFFAKLGLFGEVFRCHIINGAKDFLQRSTSGASATEITYFDGAIFLYQYVFKF